MRAIHILLFFSIIVLCGCSTIEVAKEVTKATKSIKTSIDNIVSTQEEKKSTDVIEKEKKQPDNIEKEKEKIIVEKKKERDIAKKQKKITTIKFLGKTLPELIKEFGIPDLTREDGNTKTVRFDTLSCRLFLYFNLTINKSRVEYYEIRNTIGNLVNKNKDLEKCFQEIQKL